MLTITVCMTKGQGYGQLSLDYLIEQNATADHRYIHKGNLPFRSSDDAQPTAPQS